MRHAHARNKGRACCAADTRWGLDASGRMSQGAKKTGTAGPSARYPASAGWAELQRSSAARAGSAAREPGSKLAPKAGASSGARTNREW
eukprot:5053749-Pleurochrysis_carterae.AAC.2